MALKYIIKITVSTKTFVDILYGNPIIESTKIQKSFLNQNINFYLIIYLFTSISTQTNLWNGAQFLGQELGLVLVLTF